MILNKYFGLVLLILISLVFLSYNYNHIFNDSSMDFSFALFQYNTSRPQPVLQNAEAVTSSPDNDVIFTPSSSTSIFTTEEVSVEVVTTSSSTSSSAQLQSEAELKTNEKTEDSEENDVKAMEEMKSKLLPPNPLDEEILAFAAKHWAKKVLTLHGREILFKEGGLKFPAESSDWNYEALHTDSSPIWKLMTRRAENARNVCKEYNQLLENNTRTKTILNYIPRIDYKKCQVGRLGPKIPENLKDDFCSYVYAGQGKFTYPFLTHGLSLNAYFKTGTQLLTNAVAHSLSLNLEFVKSKYQLATGMYSKRSMLSYYLEHAIGTNQGPSLDQIKKLSTEGISGIVTRHPIYRLISSWNDKFSYNSTGGAGLRYGIRRLHANFDLKRAFLKELNYLDSIDPEIMINRFNMTPSEVEKFTHRYKKNSKFMSYPRDHGEDPWHVMDFSQMMKFAATRKPKAGKKIGYMTDGHFVPYYHQRGISPCTMQYDVIIKQEFFGQEFGHLLDKVELKLPDDLDPRKSMFHSNSESKVMSSPEEVKSKLEALKVNFKKHWDRVNIEIRKKIFEIYKQDLDVFGYYWNYETNEIDFEIS